MSTPDKIHFFSDDIPFKLKDQRKTATWIRSIVLKEKGRISELNFIFCSDGRLLDLNQDFLQHNTLTDIITFDYSGDKKSLEGEIYISIDRVKENALNFKSEFDRELRRVIIHGVLHLLGYKDKKPSEKALMRKKEEACLSLLK